MQKTQKGRLFKIILDSILEKKKWQLFNTLHFLSMLFTRAKYEHEIILIQG